MKFESLHCTITVEWPASAVGVVTFTGKDTNEFGDAPFKALEERLTPGTELYIDARQGMAASVDVSAEWAKWLARRKSSFAHVSMLTGSRFIQMSADFVKRFANMGDVMRVYTDAAAFDEALKKAVSAERR